MNLPAKKILQKISNHFYWGQHTEAALRYIPVVNEIKKADLVNSKILEIGSGSTGITPYFKKYIEHIFSTVVNIHL